MLLRICFSLISGALSIVMLTPMGYASLSSNTLQYTSHYRSPQAPNVPLPVIPEESTYDIRQHEEETFSWSERLVSSKESLYRESSSIKYITGLCKSGLRIAAPVLAGFSHYTNSIAKGAFALNLVYTGVSMGQVFSFPERNVSGNGSNSSYRAVAGVGEMFFIGVATLGAGLFLLDDADPSDQFIRV